MKMAKLEVEIPARFWDYLVELNTTGLYGESVADTFIRLAEQQAQALWRDGMMGYGDTKGVMGFKRKE